MQSYAFSVFLLGALATIAPLTIDGYLPAFPSIGADFGVTQTLVQWTLSTYLFAYALMTLFHGTLSDSYGRRRVILTALGVYVVGTLGAACAPSIGVLIAGRIVQGLTAGAGMVVGQAIVRDRYDGATAQRTLSYIIMVFGVSPAFAPIVGGWLAAAWGWRAVFVTLAAVGVAVWLLCFLALPETLPRERRQPFVARVLVGHYVSVAGNARFMAMTGASAMLFGGFAFIVSAAPNFVIEVLHLPQTAFGWLFVPLVSGMMSGAWVCTRLSGRIAPARLITLGLVIMGLSCVLDLVYTGFFTARVPWAVLPIMGIAFGISLAIPCMTIRILASQKGMTGLAASVLGFVQMLMFAVSSAALVPFAFGSAFKIAVGLTAFTVLGALGWWFGARAPALPRAADTHCTAGSD